MSAQGSLLPNGRQQIFDANGNPLVGGNVYFYEPGTETPSTTWKDPAMTIPNTNPVVLDDLGSMSAYGIGSYRQIVQDASGNQLWDEVVDSGLNSDALNSGGISAQGPFLQAIAAVNINPGQLVSFNSAGQAILADFSPEGSLVPADGVASTSAEVGETVTVYTNGSLISGIPGVSPGTEYYTGAAGAITTAPLTMGSWQYLGRGVASQTLSLSLAPAVAYPSVAYPS